MTSPINYNGAASKYKNKINGESDAILSNVGRLIESDSSFSAFKRKRIAELKAIEQAGDYPTQKSLKSELTFLRDATSIVKRGYRTDNKADTIDDAVSRITKELSALVDKYASVPVNERDSFADQDFADQVGTIMNDLTRLNKQQDALSRGSGKVYNATVSSAKRNMAKIANLLDSMKEERAYFDANPLPTRSKTSQSLDITV